MISPSNSKTYVYEHKKIKIIGKSKKALDFFQNCRISYDRLFHMYCELRNYKEDGKAIFSDIWYLKKRSSGIPVINGVSVDETAYEMYVWEIRNLEPTQLISALFYQINDSAFECGFFEQEILSVNTDNVLYINPSPFIINDLVNTETIFLVPNNYYSSSYNGQFNTYKFHSYNTHLNQYINTITGIIKDEDDFLTLKSNINWCSDNIIICISVKIFNNNRNELLESLCSNGFTIYKLLLIDSSIIVSTPKKRLIIYASKKISINGTEVCSLNLIDNKMIISNESYSINNEYLHKGKMSIAAIKTNISQNQINLKNRKKPSDYEFSAEIKIQYKFVTRKGKTSAIASYLSYPDTTGKRHKIVNDIEKGLRYKNIEELPERINNILFDEKVYKIISNDLEKSFNNNYIILTIKTLWYIYRKKLMLIPGYDESISRKIFCSGYSLEKMTCLDFINGSSNNQINELLENKKTVSEKLMHIKQLYNLFYLLAKDKVILFNPFSDIMHDFSNRMALEQYEVRNALTKKNFSIEEQIKLLNSQDKYTNWNTSKKYYCLIIAFRLLVPMSIREMLALNWSDFQYNKTYNFFQLTVTKLIDRDGKHTVYGNSNDWERFRIIPLVPDLSRLLNIRKRLIQTQYNLSDEELSKIPLFSKPSTANASSRMKYDDINNICKSAIDQLGLESLKVLLPGINDVITDLNKYYSDIFLSNFRFHANHTCYMTRGEIDYIIGNTQYDTFAKHYCDFTNDAIQYAIFKKLCRWSSLLYTRNKSLTLLDDDFKNRYVKCTDYYIKATSSGTLNITVTSQFGAIIQISEKRKNND